MAPPINYLAVLVAASASMVLGFVWYGPLFGKPWMAIMGYTKETAEKMKQKGMEKTYALMTLGSLVMAYVLAHSTEFAMTYTKTYGVAGGLMSGFWNWLGFIAPILIGSQLWEGKPWKLFLITGGYYLVSLMGMGVILAVWR
ncbi:DUF1761 domain-containing protein [Candidatus Uhrbacteria bacterium]|nr:DUF1761 domain-containing protein [Candidatus Uhrbacteria bacterium]